MDASLISIIHAENAFSCSLFRANIMLIRERNLVSALQKSRILHPQTLNRRLVMDLAALFFLQLDVGNTHTHKHPHRYVDHVLGRSVKQLVWWA